MSILPPPFSREMREILDKATGVAPSGIVRLRAVRPEDRPQDDRLDGRDLRFETLEHGGSEPDTMPQAIRVTDTGGRSCIYVPLKFGGQIVEVLPD